MATTTNYGWTTPDDTALVKDGASAIRTLGSSVDTTTKNLNPETTLGDIAYRSSSSNTNTRLAIGSSGQVLTVAAGVPSWATPTDQTPLTTKGDLFTFSTVDARLGVGANGTTLVADSSEATGLKWAAPAGGGKVLQVVEFSLTTSGVNSTTTYNDSGLTCNITPSSATSKVLVLTSLRVSISRAVDDIYGQFQLLRGATVLQVQQYGAGNSDGIEGNIAYAYLDSPATTSSTTYKIQGKVNTAANSAAVYYNGDLSTIVLMEIGA